MRGEKYGPLEKEELKAEKSKRRFEWECVRYGFKGFTSEMTTLPL